MRALSKMMCATVATVALLATFAEPASAACTRLGFSVNDYGKDGPTNDAKDLLDKYIAKKMTERGVTTYRTGKKDVTCELFLNFIVFDEHTCRADATVCWDDTPLPKGEEATAVKPGTKPAAKSAAAPSTKVKATTTGSIDKPAAAAVTAPAAAETPAATEAPAVAAEVAAPAAVEAAPPAAVTTATEKPATAAAAAPKEVAPVEAVQP